MQRSRGVQLALLNSTPCPALLTSGPADQLAQAHLQVSDCEPTKVAVSSVDFTSSHSAAPDQQQKFMATWVDKLVTPVGLQPPFQAFLSQLIPQLYEVEFL